jgi:hypothetical protein
MINDKYVSLKYEKRGEKLDAYEELKSTLD